MMDLNEMMFTVSVWALPLLVAITLHEAAHGFVAWRLGDDTAFRLGRVTFNPLRHIDPFGTLLMPALLLFLSGGRMMFGFAKPVPVDFRRLRRPRRDMVLVALAGPMTNFTLAVASAALFHALPLLPLDFAKWAGHNLGNSVWINMILGVFNMIPIPPLDGGRVAVGLLPYRLGHALARLERVGIMIILGGIFILPWLGEKMGIDLNVFWWLVGGPAQYLAGTVFHLVGL